MSEMPSTEPLPPVAPLPNLPAAYPAEWSQYTKRVAAVALLIGAIVAAIVIAPILPVILGTFIMCLLISVPTRFFVNRLRMSWNLAVLLTFVVAIGAIVLLIIYLIPSVVQVLNDVLQEMSRGFVNSIDYLNNYRTTDGFIALTDTIRIDLNFILQPLSDAVKSLGATLAGIDLSSATATTSATGEAIAGASTATSTSLTPNANLVTQIVNTALGVFGTAAGAVGVLTGFIGNTVLVLLLTLITMLELPSFYRRSVVSARDDYEREYVLLLDKIYGVWMGFLRGQFTICLIIGVLTYIQLTLMGIRGASAVAAFTGLISLIPTLGGLIALVPLGIIPLLQGSTVLTQMSPVSLSLLVVVINLIGQQVIWNAVAPKIVGDAVNLPLPVIIGGLFLGTALGGILGAFLVVPILGTIRVVVVYVWRKVSGGDPYPGEPRPAWLLDHLFERKAKASA